MSADAQIEKPATSPLWTLAFRPFFLAASLWSAGALVLWVLMLMTGLRLPSRFDPLTWHVHEMLFGFVTAAIAGFILTAIPNWTGRRPIQGKPLAALTMLWLAGRIVCLLSATIPFWFAATIDVAFPFSLGLVAAREIIAAGNRRNLPLPAAILTLGVANLLMYLEAWGAAIPTGLGWRLGTAVIIILISVIAGRIVPTFTGNWLTKRGVTRLPAKRGVIDSAALGTLHAGLMAWAFLPNSAEVGWLLLLAGLVNLGRLTRWRGFAVTAEPLLAILHLGYLWVLIGAALLGAAILSDYIPRAAAIHALTAGAMGTMIVAVMSRASLGHTGRQLRADRSTILIYVLITAAAVTRIAAAFFSAWFFPLIIASAALWVGGFILFALVYGAKLMAPRI